MKQRISVEQLQELSEEQKDRLREWWKPEDLDIVYWVGTTKHIHSLVNVGDKEIDRIKARCLPLLSIGQCLELLSKEGDIETGTLMSKPIWSIYTQFSDREYTKTEFIDALWEAVKDVL